jgi:hypothetical protein
MKGWDFPVMPKNILQVRINPNENKAWNVRDCDGKPSETSHILKWNLENCISTTTV